MDTTLEFIKGPLFRLTFGIMVLGLLRMFYLSVAGLINTYIKAGDKEIPWKDVILKTLSWLIPAGRIFKMKPILGPISFLFHVGLILVPIFYLSHIQLWENSLGFGWKALPVLLADVLTIVTIVGAVILLSFRILNKDSRALSRKQDYFWPLILILPFVTGFICSNFNLMPLTYRWMMVIHILSAEAIFVMIPFTKVAHCILYPLNFLVSAMAWKFPADAGRNVGVTLNKTETPV